jgi:hypothetical protein
MIMFLERNTSLNSTRREDTLMQTRNEELPILRHRLGDRARQTFGRETEPTVRGVREDWQVVFKTQSRLLSQREALVIANHPDDTLQFLERPILAGSKKYLDWLGESTTPPPKPTTRRRSKTN